MHLTTLRSSIDKYMRQRGITGREGFSRFLFQRGAVYKVEMPSFDTSSELHLTTWRSRIPRPASLLLPCLNLCLTVVVQHCQVPRKKS